MFSNQVLEYKNSIEAGSNITTETNEYFKKEYFNSSKAKRKFSPPFLPGEIYFFRYVTDSKPTESRPFIDRFPLLICTDVFSTEKAGTVVKGIDLIVVPPRNRIDILGKIYDIYKDQIEQNDRSYEKGSAKSPINLQDSVLNVLLRGTGFKQAVFGFKYKFIRNPGVIGSEDWKKIPYMSINSLEGSSAQGIYIDYQTKLNL